MRRFPLRPLAVAGVVVAVAAAGFVAPLRAANDPYLSRQWNMAVVGTEQAWATGTGVGITIAVLDTGVDLGHEDFAPGKVVAGRNFVDPRTSPQDENGHGTHVAGIAAASTNNGRGVIGMAPGARILPVKVLGGAGVGLVDIDRAIRWAVDNGAHVINMSLGDLIGPVSDDPPFTEALDYAWSKGVISVMSAGNDPDRAAPFDNEPVIVVTATDASDRRAGYASLVGKARWGLAAPGGAGAGPIEGDVFSTYWPDLDVAQPRGYEYQAGTSMAAPHVAGAAAVLRSAGLTPEETVNRLLATAKDLGPAGRDDEFGHGRLDLARAVTGLRTPSGGRPSGTSTSTTARRTTGGQRSAAPPRSPSSTEGPDGDGAGRPRTGDRGAVATGDNLADRPKDDAGSGGSDSGNRADMRGRGPGPDGTTPDDHDDGLPWPLPTAAALLTAAVAAAAARTRRAIASRPHGPPRV